MDPNIWGPKLWNIVFDICWGLRSSKQSLEHSQSIKLFFTSLKYLLPCKYCRESYVRFFDELQGPPPCSDKALEWAYNLRNKVNDKLKKHDRPTFDKVQRRMKTYHSLASQHDVLDVLFIMATNYMADEERPEEHNIKKAWFWIMMNVLPFVLENLPQQHGLSKILMDKPVSLHDIKNKDTVMQYLCGISKTLDGRNRTVEAMCEKYMHCKNPTMSNNPDHKNDNSVMTSPMSPR